jgi:hypothetical protein
VFDTPRADIGSNLLTIYTIESIRQLTSATRKAVEWPASVDSLPSPFLSITLPNLSLSGVGFMIGQRMELYTPSLNHARTITALSHEFGQVR